MGGAGQGRECGRGRAGEGMWEGKGRGGGRRWDASLVNQGITGDGTDLERAGTTLLDLVQ